MSVEVAAWNVAHNLGREERRQSIFDHLKKLNADLLYISEAWESEWDTPYSLVEDTMGAISDFAGQQGYTSLAQIHYNDHDTVRFGHRSGFDQGMVMLGRGAVQKVASLRLVSRNATWAEVRDGTASWQTLGVHLDDRSASHRYEMTDGIQTIMKVGQPWLVLGDFNSMPMHSRPARFTNNGHVSDLAEGLLKGREAAAHLWSLFERHQAMGDDGIIDWFESQMKFKDADPKHHSTFRFHGIPLGQLDHIMVSQQLISRKFRRHRFRGSDHMAVSATISAA